VSGTTRTGELRYRPFGATRFASGTTPTSYRFTGQREEAALGLYYYNARWYDPALGHFLSPDSIVPEPGNALDYHRYAYVRFNPLKYTDPSGHCPTPPASLGPTICMALFIEPAKVTAGPYTLRGDGRSFSSNSDPLASRGYIWIPVEHPEHYQSYVNPSRYIYDFYSREAVQAHSPSKENRWTVSKEANGVIEVTYDLVISGPLNAMGAAPHINGTVRFTPNRVGSFDASFERDGFPWAEAYFHDGKGKVRTLFQDPAMRGDPYDLFAIETKFGIFKQIAKNMLWLGKQREPEKSIQMNDSCRLNKPC
jgi:RHS repeat-associated protein